MGRPCSICTHGKRDAIEADLVAGRPYRDIARAFRVSRGALGRHRSDHLPDRLQKGLALAAAKEAETVAEQEEARAQGQAEHALDVVRQLKAINAASLEILHRARETRQDGLLLKAVDRVHRQIELQSKLLGEIDQGPTVQLAVLPEWQSLRLRIVEALRPFPEARLAVQQALRTAE